MLRARGKRTWVEPFVGGANVIQAVKDKRIGNDAHPELIALLKAVSNGYIPPDTITKSEYNKIKNNQDNYPPELVGFVGFLCSFGSKWYGGYAHNTKGSNYAALGCRALLKQAPLLRGIDFRCGGYNRLDIPDKSLVYCDPPYKSTQVYTDTINHEKFFDWCRSLANQNHIVYVTEYEMPKDFTLIRRISHTSKLNLNNKEDRVEKLFTLV